VSQSVDLGQNNNPNTTPTKDYENVRVVVYLHGVQRGCAEEGECQVRVYSSKGSGQVRMETDEGQGQRAGQEISPAGVGDHLDSTTKDNER